MPDFEFRFSGLIQSLDADVFLAETLLIPEISCLSDDRNLLLNALEHNAGVIIEDTPQAHLCRRMLAGDVLVEELNVLLDPPKRSTAWREPVELSLPLVHWQHGEQHLAYIPVLGIEVIATSDDDLKRLLPLHVKSALLRGKRMALAKLAPLQRTHKLEVESFEVAVHLLSPRRRAEEDANRKEDENKTLKEVATDLTKETLAEAFEVEEIVARVAEILSAKTPHSVLLVGPSGVGKTAIVHELVRRRHDFALRYTPFWATSGSRLVAGMSGFGMWQQRCQEVWREASKTKAILHLGNLMELLDVGKSEFHSQGIASFLRPYLARGDLLAIAECLPEQKPLIERQDPHLLHAFVEVRVEEPDRKRGQAILASSTLQAAIDRPRDAPFPLEPAALDTLDTLHRRYATYSAYPGRPLRFLRNLLTDLDVYSTLTSSDVTAGFARETGLPLFLLDDRVPLDLDEAKRWFAGRVIGQAEAVDLVVDLLATVKARLARPRKPIASLLFIGPTGVGKTEMAKALAGFLFGSSQRLTRFDMSEYADPLAVQRLIGSSHAGEGLLTAKVREQPFSVILLDEFEKADPQLFDLLLQVLGEGRLTDAAGRLADFSNSVVIMTSNLGAASYQQGTAGFTGLAPGAGEEARQQAKEHFVREVRAFVRPELFNRIDRIVPFAPLDEATILGIARRQLDMLQSRDGVRYRGVSLQIATEVAGWLACKGYDVRYGARPLKRAIERELLAPLAEQMNQYTSETPLRVAVDMQDEALDITVRARTDESGRQAGTGGADVHAARLAEACVELRRHIQAVSRCAEMREVLNEIFRLERIEKRQREGKRNAFSEDVRGFARLPHYRELRDDMNEQMRQACTREDEVILGLQSEGPLDVLALATSRDEGDRRLDKLLRALYVLRFDDPDRATLAIFSEEPGPLWALTSAYADIVDRLRGTFELWQFLPEHEARDEHSSPERRRVIDPHKTLGGAEHALVQWWDRKKLKDRGEEVVVRSREGVIGMALRIEATHAFPLFAAEAGLHQFISTQMGGKCLVEASELPLCGAKENTFYLPPAGIERRGAVGSQPKRRVIQVDRGQVEDVHLNRRQSWDGNSLANLVAELMEENLRNNARKLLTP
jgi:ATP-dependent Clp protease ATP-binding subunit ClpA